MNIPPKARCTYERPGVPGGSKGPGGPRDPGFRRYERPGGPKDLGGPEGPEKFKGSGWPKRSWKIGKSGKFT